MLRECEGYSGGDTYMPSTEIGCCGAYCGTCRELTEGKCSGCKLGYDTGERDLAKARCKIKVCCISKVGLAHTCVDCSGYVSCNTLQDFYSKKGYKYKKYKESMEFIRIHGYDSFLKNANKWKGAYGRLP